MFRLSKLFDGIIGAISSPMCDGEKFICFDLGFTFHDKIDVDVCVYIM
jgi:hypothetical protein